MKVNPHAAVLPVYRLPGVVRREIAEARLKFFDRDGLALLAGCPLVEGHILRVKLLDPEEVDLFCLGGCGAQTLVSELTRQWIEVSV